MSEGLSTHLLEGGERSIRDNPYWNITLLALAWAMTLSTSTLLTTIGPLCAQELGLSDNIAAFTIGAFLIGAAVSSVPSGPLFRVYGRYIGFTTGCVCQLIGGGLGVLAMMYDIPTALFMSCFFLGLSQGLGQFYRFSAMEVAPPQLKSRAVTYVLTGGVLSAFVGPTTATYSNNMLPKQYVGSFILMGGIAFLNQLVIILTKFPKPPQKVIEEKKGAKAEQMDSSSSKFIEARLRGEKGTESIDSEHVSIQDAEMRTRYEIISQPLFIASCTVATLAHTLMVMVMSNVSVAMTDGGFSFSQANLVLELHFLAMFAPGFFTGTLMSLIGTFTVSLIGAIIFAGSAVVLAIGDDLWNYMIGMILVGIAWNFSFTAGTVMLSGCYSVILHDAHRLHRCDVSSLVSFRLQIVQYTYMIVFIALLICLYLFVLTD